MWYKVGKKIASGGICDVFEGTAVGSNDFKRPVVIKRLKPQFAHLDSMYEKLAAEAELLASVYHNNLAQVLEFLDIDEIPSIVLEKVEGASVELAAKNAGGDDVERARLCRRLLSGVARLFYDISERCGRSFVHGDISAANIIFTDSTGSLKVIDLGEGSLSSEEDGASGGFIYATPQFAAPELAETGATVCADVYALGKVALYLCPSPPGDLEGLLGMMTAVDPARRLQSWREVLLLLGEPLGEAATGAQNRREMLTRKIGGGAGSGGRRFILSAKFKILAAGAILGLVAAAGIAHFETRIERKEAGTAASPKLVDGASLAPAAQIEKAGLETAYLKLAALPKTAFTATIDGEPIDEPSLQALALSPGYHRVEVMTEDGKTYSQKLTLFPGQAVTAHIIPREKKAGEDAALTPKKESKKKKSGKKK